MEYKSKSQDRSKCAYGTFLFKDGGYLPGLLLTAYKIRELDPKGVKIICCYTNDIGKHILNVLSLLYDYIHPVDYLQFGRSRVGRQAPLSYMFTRFRFLQLAPPYFTHHIDKVIILDADLLPLRSFDALFDLNAPAGVINEDKNSMKGSLHTLDKLDKWEWHHKYEPISKHGNIIPEKITDRPLLQPNENMGINGGLMMLAPSEADFEKFSKWCKKATIEEAINKMNWPDMQAITSFYSGKWTSIDAKYLGLYGYPNIKSLKGIHFIGPKPWQWRVKGFSYRLNNYPDYRLWAEEYLKMCKVRPELLKYKPLLALKQNIESSLVLN